jgi:hypothetical protein
MAQKDPVCNMMVDEKKARHISEARKSICVLHNVKVSLIRTLTNMDTKRGIFIMQEYI